jgi:plastocyanin
VTNPIRALGPYIPAMRRLVVLAVALFALASLGAAGGEATPAQATKLHARVGPSFTISLSTEAGAPVRSLDPGAYEITVDDMSEEHNFHLTGPGVDRSTEIGEVGTQTWTVTLRDGSYRFVCDPHQGTMRGSFTVGNVTTQPPAPKPPANAVTPRTKLRLTSGPGFTISLRTAAGKAVKTMTTGTYTVAVRDRSTFHNAHLVGPGYNRRTTVPYVGSQTWKARLARAGTLRFLCDPHATQMRGSARIVRR